MTTDLSIDFSDVTADQFTVVPPGEYETIVDKVEMRRKEPTEEQPEPAHYLNFDLKIADGEHSGRHLFFVASFSEKSVGRTKALLESFGVDVNGKVRFKVDEETNELTEPNLVGEPANARVRIEKSEEWGEQSRVRRLKGSKVAVGAGANSSPKYK